VLLNSDTRLSANWLNELIGSFSLFPRAGIIGSKLLNEDMTLQEAGGILWRDGSAWNYGRGDDPDNPKYSFARQVDYCSGCAIAIRTSLWRKLGGFDTEYAPAYYEDVDLAFRAREAGFEVWMQPLAGVLHYEGRTHGRDTGSGIKAHQVTNRDRFSQRWQRVLAGHGASGLLPDMEANRYAPERLLVIDATTLTPDRDAGSFVAMRTLRLLRGLGYQVVFVPHHNYLHAGQYTEALQREGVECLYEPFVRGFAEVPGFHGGFDVVLGYRFNVLGDVHAQIRAAMPHTRILFNNVDLHYLRQEREAALHGSRAGRIAAMVTKAAELALIAQADCTIVHTETESRIIRNELPISNIVTIPWIAELSPTKAAFDRRHHILYLGGFAHQPNVDAVEHFVREIWPLVVPRLPETARLVIAGATPPPAIEALAGGRIEVTGYVEDLHDAFDAARVFVAPLRYGAGIKGKVIESLRRGVPAVISPIAAEGIGLRDREEAIIAELGPAFADAIVALYDEPETWARLREAGFAFVSAHFSVERCTELFRKALDIADDTWIERQERALRRRLDRIRAGEDDADTAAGRCGEARS
jgi:glycosyltransferase involved in cell wall biosynthesis